jgi:polyferredoxin
MYKRKFTRSIRLTVLLITVIIGFVVLPPLLPLQFQALITRTTAEPAIAVIMILIVFFAITLVVGRIFCGYVCPIGAVQELAYEIPMKKVQFRK